MVLRSLEVINLEYTSTTATKAKYQLDELPPDDALGSPEDEAQESLGGVERTALDRVTRTV